MLACNADRENCPLYGVAGCPLFRGCLSIEVNGSAIGSSRIVRYIVGVRYSGVSVKRGSTVDGIWKCTNKDCEVVRQGRIRSMESGTSCDVFLTPLAGSFKAGELHLATVARVTRWSSPACFAHARDIHARLT